MKILVDTNIAVTYATGRESDFQKDACFEIIRLCSEELVDGYFAFHSVSNMWFILKGLKKIKDGKKTDELLMTKSQVRKSIKCMCEILTVVGATNEQILKIVDNEEFTDFEDGLQSECAKNAGVDYIITGNVKDFKKSGIKAVTPEEFIEIYKKLIGEAEKSD